MKHNQRQERDNQLGGGGGGSPNLARWRNADARPNAPAPRISPSPKASPKGALAGVQRTIQPTLGTTLALAPRRGGDAPRVSAGSPRRSRAARFARAVGVGLPEREARTRRAARGRAVARGRAELARRLKGEPTPQTPRPAPEGKPSEARVPRLPCNRP